MTMTETLDMIGDAGIMERRKVALLCSQKCPGALILEMCIGDVHRGQVFTFHTRGRLGRVSPFFTCAVRRLAGERNRV
jgi:hypothetical protein